VRAVRARRQGEAPGAAGADGQPGSGRGRRDQGARVDAGAQVHVPHLRRQAHEGEQRPFHHCYLRNQLWCMLMKAIRDSELLWFGLTFNRRAPTTSWCAGRARHGTARCAGRGSGRSPSTAGPGVIASSAADPTSAKSVANGCSFSHQLFAQPSRDMLKGRNKEQALLIQECSISSRSIYCIFTGFLGSLNRSC
jgi:hypothetical protein